MKQKKLKTISEDEGLKGILPKYRAGEPYQRTLRAAGIIGSQHTLAWHRGKHAGWIDSIVALRKLNMPRAAKKLMIYFNINEGGSIILK